MVLRSIKVKETWSVIKLAEIRSIGQTGRVVFVVVQSCAEWIYRTYCYLHTIRYDERYWR